MPRKARETSDGSRTTFTIRLPPATGSWMYDLAQKTDRTLTDIVNIVVDDCRTWFGLDEQLVRALIQRDADALKLNQRDYISYLLTERCAAVKVQVSAIVITQIAPS